MRLCQIMEILDAEILCCHEKLEDEVAYGFGSDLMSDVLAYVKGSTVLLTGLINSQVIRTAEMAELNAIIFVRGKKPEEDIINLARENDIALLLTKETMFSASGKLYNSGLSGVQLD